MIAHPYRWPAAQPRAGHCRPDSRPATPNTYLDKHTALPAAPAEQGTTHPHNSPAALAELPADFPHGTPAAPDCFGSCAEHCRTESTSTTPNTHPDEHTALPAAPDTQPADFPRDIRAVPDCFDARAGHCRTTANNAHPGARPCATLAALDKQPTARTSDIPAVPDCIAPCAGHCRTTANDAHPCSRPAIPVTPACTSPFRAAPPHPASTPSVPNTYPAGFVLPPFAPCESPLILILSPWRCCP